MKRINLVVSFVLLFSFCSFKVNGQVCFTLVDTIAKGNNLGTIITVDFNGDGKADLSGTAPGANYISVLLGTGTGGFGIAINYTTGSSPADLISEDFNGDGIKDLAVTNEFSNSVSILLGTGTGGFGIATNYSVGTDPYDLTCADFNGDGKKDLAICNILSYNVLVLLGTGTGSFGTPYTVIDNTSSGYMPLSIVHADFNLDGNIDLAVTYRLMSGSINNMYVYLGDGAGNFGSATVFFVGGNFPTLMSADLNGDGKSDIISLNSPNHIAVLLGTGAGSFGSATTYTTGNQPQRGTVADFNKDGIADIAISNSNYNGIDILLGTGGGNFANAVSFTIDTNEAVVSADFNGDTMPDLAVASTDSYILLNCNPVGIESFSTDESIRLYPNPASTILNIESSSQNEIQNETVYITDVLGNEILRAQQKQIDISDLQNGIYFVKVRSKERLLTKKIIIQH